MLRSVRSLLARRSDSPDATSASDAAQQDLPRPLRPTYVIGDIHGRADLLELMLELIDAHIGGTAASDPQLVFVGDYIDLGPDSAAVLTRMRELQSDFPDNVTCLLGNHERMMLDFLDDPATRGARWLRAGAAATLKSFGISTTELESGIDVSAFADAARTLEQSLPSADLNWVKSLPLSWSSGNLWVVHAGADPGHAMEDQSARVLLWGHPEFDSALRGDDVWVAHGHTEVDTPHAADGRIACDTGAWQSNRLTACAIRKDGRHDFLQT